MQIKHVKQEYVTIFQIRSILYVANKIEGDTMRIIWQNICKIIERELQVDIIKTDNIVIEEFNYQTGKWSPGTLPLVKKIIVRDPLSKNGVSYLIVAIEVLDGDIWEIKVRGLRNKRNSEFTKTVSQSDIIEL